MRELVDVPEARRLIRELKRLPRLIECSLADVGNIQEIAETFFEARDFLSLGRGVNSPTAMEGALKLKEISYIHAEAYAAGEMKHGPIALIDHHMPVTQPKARVGSHCAIRHMPGLNPFQTSNPEKQSRQETSGRDLLFNL